MYRFGVYSFNAYAINENKIAERIKNQGEDMVFVSLNGRCMCILNYNLYCTDLILINDLDHLE